MTETAMGNDTKWWVGIVVSTQDPHQSGRLRVRVLGMHDDTTNIPDSSLPWAQVVQPVTSAARGRIGTAPVGAVEGSRVVGIWADRDQQYPIILGTLGRAGEPIPGQTQGGAPQVNTAVGSIPAAAQGSFTNPYTSLTTDRITIAGIESGQQIDSVALDQGNVATQAVRDEMQAADLPSVASQPKQSTGALNLVTAADPTGQLSILPCLNLNLLNIHLQLNLAAFANGLIAALSAAIQNAILELASRIGLGRVLALLNTAAQGIAKVSAYLNVLRSVQVCGVNPLNNDVLDTASFILADAMNVVNGASNFIYNGVSDIAAAAAGVTSSALTGLIVKPLANVPSAITFTPLATLAEPTAGFIQQYYPYDSDPYPGYIRWNDPANVASPVFTLRNGQPNYTSAQQHTQFYMQDAFVATTLNGLVRGTITSDLLSQAINDAYSVARVFGATRVLGAGVAGAAAVVIAAVLIPSVAKGVTNVFQPARTQSILPTSVDTRMREFQESQMLLARRRQTMRIALQR